MNVHRRHRSRNPLRGSSAEVRAPVVHQTAAALEQGRSRVGSLHLVPDLGVLVRARRLAPCGSFRRGVGDRRPRVPVRGSRFLRVSVGGLRDRRLEFPVLRLRGFPDRRFPAAGCRPRSFRVSLRCRADVVALARLPPARARRFSVVRLWFLLQLVSGWVRGTAGFRPAVSPRGVGGSASHTSGMGAQVVRVDTKKSMTGKLIDHAQALETARPGEALTRAEWGGKAAIEILGDREAAEAAVKKSGRRSGRVGPGTRRC